MKPNTLDRKVTGNLQGQRITMGFAAGAEKHLMGMMASMYSDMELAIVREYATNAFDSHTEAGQQNPIEIFLPSPLAPYLKIKDYGVGMNVDDIHRTYSQYGASTKRDSNAYNGMLGIGSKAALAYSGQFTVIAVKDGVRTTVAVTRDQDGSNTMVIVDTVSTPEHNGVEISIPVKAGHSIPQKAHNLFMYWPEGSVLINGKPPEKLNEAGLEITADIKLIQGERYGGEQSKVVMGNVVYPAGALLDSQHLGIEHGYAIIAYVPVGAVDFAPSREALTFSKHTNDCLARIAAEFKKGLVAAIQRNIEQAATPHEAVRAVNSWARLLGRNRPASFRHKGRDLPTTIVRPADKRMLLTNNQSYRFGAASSVQSIDLSYLDRAVFITEFDMASHTATHKKKARQWLENDSTLTHQDVGHFVLVDFPLDTHWIAPERVVSWPVIKAQVLPREARTVSGRLPGSYDVLQKSRVDDYALHINLEGSKIDRSKPLFWVHGNQRTASQYSSVLDHIESEYTIICLPENRIAKFTRENPTIKNVQTALKDAFDRWCSGLSSDIKIALAINDEYGAHSNLSRLRGKSIDDPDVAKAVRIAQLDVTKYVDARQRFARRGERLPMITWDNPLDKYPLFDVNYAYESIEYMNLIYAARKKVI